MPSINKQKIEQLYNERVQRYGNKHAMLDAHPDWLRANEFHHYASLRDVKKLLSPVHKKVILDYGCGIGRLCIPLTNEAAFIFGVDTNAQAIELAIKKATDIPNIRFMTIKQPEDVSIVIDNKIDVVFTYGVLCHMYAEEIQRLFVALKPLLSERARLIFIEPVEHAETAYSDEVMTRRTKKDWQLIFNEGPFYPVKHSMLLRWPSYARHIWNSRKWIPHLALPLLYWLEKFTLHRKARFIEYSFDAFELRAK